MLDHASIYDDSSRSPEAALIQFFLEVRRRKPAVIFIPNLNSWWMTSSDLVKNILMDQIFQLDPHDPILVLAVATHFNDESLNDAKKIFEANDFSFNRPLFLVPVPDREARRVYFEAFLLESHTELNGLILSEDTGDCFVVPAVFHEDNFRKESTQEVTSLKKAPPAPPRKLTAKEIKLLHEYDESVFRRLRMFIREFMHEFLRCKDYKSLTKNLNVCAFSFHHHFILFSQLRIMVMLSSLTVKIYWKRLSETAIKRSKYLEKIFSKVWKASVTCLCSAARCIDSLM